MEIGELAQTRLIVLGVLLAIAAWWAAGRAAERRRQARFTALAQALGAEGVRAGDLHWHFATAVGDRPVDVRHRYLGSQSAPGSRGWRVITEMPLRGVSELHSAEIRPRTRRRFAGARDTDFGSHFAIRDFGMPLREGWLGPRVRTAVGHFYALDLPLDSLSIEEGRLVHRAAAPLKRFDAAALRELLARQATVATALERAL
jgi:hypothetical protein